MSRLATAAFLGVTVVDGTLSGLAPALSSLVDNVFPPNKPPAAGLNLASELLPAANRLGSAVFTLNRSLPPNEPPVGGLN